MVRSATVEGSGKWEKSDNWCLKEETPETMSGVYIGLLLLAFLFLLLILLLIFFLGHDCLQILSINMVCGTKLVRRLYIRDQLLVND